MGDPHCCQRQSGGNLNAGCMAAFAGTEKRSEMPRGDSEFRVLNYGILVVEGDVESITYWKNSRPSYYLSCFLLLVLSIAVLVLLLACVPYRGQLWLDQPSQHRRDPFQDRKSIDIESFVVESRLLHQ